MSKKKSERPAAEEGVQTSAPDVASEVASDVETTSDIPAVLNPDEVLEAADKPPPTSPERARVAEGGRGDPPAAMPLVENAPRKAARPTPLEKLKAWVDRQRAPKAP